MLCVKVEAFFGMISWAFFLATGPQYSLRAKVPSAMSKAQQRYGLMILVRAMPLARMAMISLVLERLPRQ